MTQLTEPPVSNPIIICFHKIGPNNCVILQVYVPNALNVTLNKVNIDQPREMLSADQSLRDRRSRGLWSVLNISRGFI